MPRGRGNKERLSDDIPTLEKEIGDLSVQLREQSTYLKQANLRQKIGRRNLAIQRIKRSTPDFERLDGNLEIDRQRGVIYFHLKDGSTKLRICRLPIPIPSGKFLDLTWT